MRVYRFLILPQQTGKYWMRAHAIALRWEPWLALKDKKEKKNARGPSCNTIDIEKKIAENKEAITAKIYVIAHAPN